MVNRSFSVSKVIPGASTSAAPAACLRFFKERLAKDEKRASKKRASAPFFYFDNDAMHSQWHERTESTSFILMRKGEQLWRQSGELDLERLKKAVKDFKS